LSITLFLYNRNGHFLSKGWPLYKLVVVSHSIHLDINNKKSILFVKLIKWSPGPLLTIHALQHKYLSVDVCLCNNTTTSIFSVLLPKLSYFILVCHLCCHSPNIETILILIIIVIICRLHNLICIMNVKFKMQVFIMTDVVRVFNFVQRNIAV
jgi:hypothetical protein